MQQQHGIQTLKPVQTTAETGNRARSIKCMFTAQLTKKRKTWSDGVLKVYFAGGCFQCSLIDTGKLRETVLASRPLERVEVDKLKKNEDAELEFENYLVTVAAGIDVDAVGPPLKLPKFVPPARYIPPPKPEVIPVQSMQPAVSAVGRPYKVTSDELDDLWDRDEASTTRPPARPAASAVEAVPVPHQSAHYNVPRQNSAQAAPNQRAQQASSSGSNPSQPPVTAYFQQAPPTRNTHTYNSYGSAASTSSAAPALGRVGVHVVREDTQSAVAVARASATAEFQPTAPPPATSYSRNNGQHANGAYGSMLGAAPYAPAVPARPTAYAALYDADAVPQRQLGTSAVPRPSVPSIPAATAPLQSVNVPSASSTGGAAYSTIISKSIWDDDE
jgi:hypothetical protein